MTNYNQIFIRLACIKWFSDFKLLRLKADCVNKLPNNRLLLTFISTNVNQSVLKYDVLMYN